MSHNQITFVLQFWHLCHCRNCLPCWVTWYYCLAQVLPEGNKISNFGFKACHLSSSKKNCIVKSDFEKPFIKRTKLHVSANMQPERWNESWWACKSNAGMKFDDEHSDLLLIMILCVLTKLITSLLLIFLTTMHDMLMHADLSNLFTLY